MPELPKPPNAWLSFLESEDCASKKLPLLPNVPHLSKIVTSNKRLLSLCSRFNTAGIIQVKVKFTPTAGEQALEWQWRKNDGSVVHGADHSTASILWVPPHDLLSIRILLRDILHGLIALQGVGLLAGYSGRLTLNVVGETVILVGHSGHGKLSHVLLWRIPA